MSLVQTGDSISSGQDSLWQAVASFFTSVRTAISLLFLLAAASIVGTVVPQDVGLDHIGQSAGSFYFRLSAILDLHKVYRSWWFILLLVLLSLNLVGCLTRRLRAISEEWRGNSEKNSFIFTACDARQPAEVQALIVKVLTRVLRTQPRISENLGVVSAGWIKHRIYLLGFPLIHLAIIVILLGAVIGVVYGFKGTIKIKEGAIGNKFTLIPSGRVQSLPFEIAVDSFTLARYSTGEPKEFRSDVRILRNGAELSKGSIRVNHPLTVERISLYQSDYRVLGVKEVKLAAVDSQGKSVHFTLQPRVATDVPSTEYTAKLVSLDPGVTKRGTGVEITVGRAGEQASPLKLFRNDSEPIKLKDIELRFLDYQPLYATGLQVGYDPGAQVVWIGCILLILGFSLSLFTNLRRIDAEITRENGLTRLKVSGRSRKMRGEFREMVESRIRKSFEIG
ncbi:MAG: cytochrome c biogenesis protein ResB [Desulfomonile sp.]